MVGLLSRNYGRVGNQRKVNPWVGHKIGLKFCQVHIESTIKAERCSDGGYDLANQPVEVGVSWPVNVKVPPANVIDGLIVHHERTIRVLRVVWVVRMEL